MRYIPVVLLFLGWMPALAQEIYSLRNYKAIDGLPQSQVNIMLEDQNGYLWIGTHGGGLARFDGREFTVYTTRNGLQSNIVNYLKLDAQQNLWIAHPRGITRFDGRSFKTFEESGSSGTSRRIRRIFEFQDTIFFTSNQLEMGKIYKDSVYYWSQTFDGLLVGYTHLAPDRDVMIYLNDSTFLVRGLDGDFKMKHSHRFNRLLGIFNYGDKVWVKTDSGYFKADFEKRDFVRASLPVKNPVVYYDGVNDVFWTRHKNALLKEKIQDGAVTTDTVIRDLVITQILVDSEGNTWFGTDGEGLYKYFVQDFDRCSSNDLRGVWAIHRDGQGDTWIGTMSRGLWKASKGKVQSYVWDKQRARNEVFCVSESPQGDIWIGTRDGLARYDRARDDFKWFGRDEGLSNAFIQSIVFDPHGGMWVGTLSGGINYYDGQVFTSYAAPDRLMANRITALHFSETYGRLYAGNEFGVFAVADGDVHIVPIVGVENTSVSSIHAYQDSLLLVGSHGAGLVIFNPRTNFSKLITTQHGLASDFIYFAAPDSEDNIWVGTEKGITRLKLSRRFELTENLHFGYDNGLAGVETNTNAFFLAEDVKYFGLIDGLYKFNDIERKGFKSFDLHLTDVDLFYGEYAIRDYADSLVGFFKIPYNPQLPPDRNHITFHFNRVDKRYPKSVKFKYYLENFDKTWSQPSSNSYVTYSNLPPGNYTFHVTATDTHGTWSSASVYPFTVKTPFYQTASFIVGMFILLAGAITLGLYIRVRQRVHQVMMLERIRAEEQEMLRKEIARDFHDEMGNQLTRIINYVSLLKLSRDQSNGNGQSGHTNGLDLYTKVEDSAKYLYTGTRDFIWSIDPVNDELSKLFIHIRDFGEKLFEEKNINFRAYNEIKGHTRLPYGFSREANLIFKEVMTNAFKYSGATNVTLSLVGEGDVFEMTFEDDGIGFDTAHVQKSNGLKNIRVRADRIQAILRIQSITGKGTKVTLQFKLNKTLKYGLAV